MEYSPVGRSSLERAGPAECVGCRRSRYSFPDWSPQSLQERSGKGGCRKASLGADWDHVKGLCFRKVNSRGKGSFACGNNLS